MPESQTCKICGKPATVHLTQIVGNKIQKVDLCEACAHEKGVTDPEGFSLGELLNPGATQAPSREAMVCEHCGFSPKDFKKLGRFGCPACYEFFAPIIEPMLRNMHSGVTHRGKVPGRSIERLTLKRQLGELEEALRTAVQQEHFEEAARLRDQIAGLRDTLNIGVADD